MIIFHILSGNENCMQHIIAIRQKPHKKRIRKSLKTFKAKTIWPDSRAYMMNK